MHLVLVFIVAVGLYVLGMGTNSGSLAIFAAIRRASSRVSSLAADRRAAVACRASNSLAAIWSNQRTSNILYSRKMEWGQLSIFFAVACFAAIALFMISR
jgi:hypothetical protein